MIKQYSSMPAFLLHQAAQTLRRERRGSIGLIRGRGRPAGVFLDFGRHSRRMGSLILRPNPRAIALAAAKTVGLLALIFAVGSALYQQFGRRR